MAGPAEGHSLAEMTAFTTVTIWGASFALQKLALAQFDVGPFLALRYLGMLLLSWVVLGVWHRATGRAILVRRADLPAAAFAGVLGYALYIPAATLGLHLTTSFSNALLIATAPLFAALLLRALRLQTLGLRHWAGMLVALTGVALFLFPAMRGASARAGDVLSLGAALCFAGYSVAGKRLLPRYSPVVVTAYTLTFGTAPVILATLPSIGGQDWTRVTSAGWGAFAWTAVMPLYVAWTLWSWTMARMGVARATLFMYLVPVIGGVASRLMLGEQWRGVEILGAAVTLAGLVIARRGAPGPGAAAAPRGASLPQAPGVCQQIFANPEESGGPVDGARGADGRQFLPGRDLAISGSGVGDPVDVRLGPPFHPVGIPGPAGGEPEDVQAAADDDGREEPRGERTGRAGALRLGR